MFQFVLVRRTATCGDVHLEPTPGQWQPVPKLLFRRLDANAIVTRLRYPEEEKSLRGLNPMIYPDMAMEYRGRCAAKGIGYRRIWREQGRLVLYSRRCDFRQRADQAGYFSELLEYPFLWQQTEYVLGGGAFNFMFRVLVVQSLLGREERDCAAAKAENRGM